MISPDVRLRERKLTAVELHRGTNNILLQCRLHQSLVATSLPSNFRRCFRISLGSGDLRVPNHSILHRLCHRHYCRLLPCLVLLVQAPGRVMHRRSELLPMERHRQHASGRIGAMLTVPNDMACKNVSPTEVNTNGDIPPRWIVSPPPNI
jgi:hypothetical protein